MPCSMDYEENEDVRDVRDDTVSLRRATHEARLKEKMPPVGAGGM